MFRLFPFRKFWLCYEKEFCLRGSVKKLNRKLFCVIPIKWYFYDLKTWIPISWIVFSLLILNHVFFLNWSEPMFYVFFFWCVRNEVETIAEKKSFFQYVMDLFLRSMKPHKNISSVKFWILCNPGWSHEEKWKP